MSGSGTIYTEQSVLGHTLGFAPMAFPAQVFVGLCSAAMPPSETVQGVEAFGNGYARMPATFALVATPANIAANVATVEYPRASGGWGTLGFFELWDAPAGGNRLYWGALIDTASQLPITITVASGDIVRFSAGTLAVQATTGAGGTSSVGAYLPLAGGTLTGALLLASDPTTYLQAATKQYVDAHSGTGGGPGFLPLSGGTMLGTLTLAADPAGALQSATKQYVDGKIVSSGVTSFNNTGRNLLHNPLFNVAQRGVGPWSTDSTYTLDRWLLSRTLDTVSVAQSVLSDASRTAIGDESATQSLINGFTGNVGAGAFNFITQWIEGVRRLGGKTVTVSFYAIASAAGMKLGINAMQNYGTGGTALAWIQPVGAAVTLSTAWTRYSVSLAIPSTTGKTMGSANDSTGLALWFSSGATNNAIAGNVGVQSGTVSIWGVQLEIGSVATPLEKPDPRYDLSNCQRFYQSGLMQLYGYNLAGQPVAVSNLLPVTMRATPTVTPTWTANANVTAPTMSGAIGFISMSASATTSNNFTLQGNFTASADL